jgi:hypothetical protein
MLTTLAGTGCVQAEKEQLIEQHEAEIRLLERKHAGRHERVQSEHEDELKRMKQHEDDELSRLRRELKSEADARVHSLETKLAEVERQKGMDLFAAREEMVGAIERIKQARLSLLACQIACTSARALFAWQEHQDALLAHGRQHEEEIQRVRVECAASISRDRDAWEEELIVLRESHAAKIVQLDEERRFVRFAACESTS